MSPDSNSPKENADTANSTSSSLSSDDVEFIGLMKNAGIITESNRDEDLTPDDVNRIKNI